MNLRNKVLSGLCWSAGAKLTGQMITWSVTIIVIRLLTPGDYGLMSIAGIFVAFLAMLGEMGFGSAIIQRKIKEIQTLRKVLGALVLVSSLFFVLLFTTASFIAIFFREPKLVPIIQVLSVQFLLMCFVVIPQSLLAQDLDFKRSSLVEFGAAISASVVTLVLALSGFGVWSLVWGVLAQQLFRVVGLNVVSPFPHLPSFNLRGIRQILSFGSFVTIERSLWYFYTQSDSMIIGRLLGKELLGFYSVGLQLASLPMDKFTGIVSQVAFPAFSKLQEDRRSAGVQFLKAVRIMSFFAFPVLWGASSLAPEIVELILGQKWQSAIVPFQFLSLVVPVRMVSNLIAPALLGMGRPDLSLRNTITAALALPAALLVGAYWGLAGVSLAWVVVFPLVFLLNLRRAVTILDIKLSDVLGAMLRSVCSAAAMYVAVMIAKYLVVDQFSSNIVVCVFSLVVFGAFSYFLMVCLFNRNGCKEVVGLMKS